MSMIEHLSEEEKYRQMLSSPDLSQQGNDLLSELDLDKFKNILKKNWYWLFLIPSLCLALAYIALRYIKPLYKSESNLKMEIKDENNTAVPLAVLNSDISPVEDNLVGELEVIKSPIIYEEVFRRLDLSVSYFSEGRILENELYNASPVQIKTDIKNEVICGQKIYLSWIDVHKYQIKFYINHQPYTYEGFYQKKLSTPFFDITTYLNRNFEEEGNSLFFIINNRTMLNNEFNKNLEAIIVNPKAKIISISYKDYNPVKAQTIVKTISEVYQQKSVEIKNRTNRQKIDFLDDRIEKTEEELKQYEIEYEGFIIKNKTLNPESKIGELIDQIRELTLQEVKLREKYQFYLDLQLFINNPKALDSPIPVFFDSAQDPSLSGFMAQLVQIKSEKEKLALSDKAGLTLESQKVLQKFNEIQNSFNASLAYGKKKAAEQLSDIEIEISNLSASFVGIPSKMTELNRIRQAYNIVKNKYDKLTEQRLQIGLAEAGTVPSFEIIAPAVLPTIPIFPKKTFIYGVAGAVGIFLSLIALLATYFLQNTISSLKELEKISAIPILGAIPKYNKGKLETSRLIIHNTPKSSISEAFRGIRTNLDFMFPNLREDKKRYTKKVISITSTISGEGKTFAALNLSGVIAMSGMKVILIDVDMRKPKVHLSFDHNNDKGLSTILIGRHSYRECIRSTEIDSLDYIAAGPIPPNPSELIIRSDFSTLLHHLQEQYDVVITDTPPVGLVTDAMLVMQYADLRLFMIRANYSKRSFVKTIQRIIKASSLFRVGWILNSVESKAIYGGYKYGGYYEDENNTPPVLKKIQKILLRKNA